MRNIEVAAINPYSFNYTIVVSLSLAINRSNTKEQICVRANHKKK